MGVGSNGQGAVVVSHDAQDADARLRERLRSYARAILEEMDPGEITDVKMRAAFMMVRGLRPLIYQYINALEGEHCTQLRQFVRALATELIGEG